MVDLAGRGPLGQKAGRSPKKPRRRIKPISDKKRARRDAEKAEGAQEHMARVAALPCLVCGRYGVEVHHEGSPRSDFNVLPLCHEHHRREFGPGAYHYSKRAFYARHGTSEELLARVKAMLGK